MYSITTLCRMTGLNASTLRSWERRYGVPAAVRTDNGRRLYSKAEVDRLSLIAGLVKTGHMIGDVIEKTAEDLGQMAGESRARAQQASAAYLDRLNAAVSGRDYHTLRRELVGALTLLPAIEAIDDVIAPFLRGVGAAWVAGELTIHEEHIITAITKQVLFVAGANASWPRPRPTLAFTTPVQETHEVGILLGWFLAVNAGLNTVYLGPALPDDEILGVAGAMDIEIVTISLVNCFPENRDVRKLISLANRLAPGAQLWVGAPDDHPVHQLSGEPNIQSFTNFRSFASALAVL
jgi:DNA-binding transcriptional MerR regulator